MENLGQVIRSSPSQPIDFDTYRGFCEFNVPLHHRRQGAESYYWKLHHLKQVSHFHKLVFQQATDSNWQDLQEKYYEEG